MHESRVVCVHVTICYHENFRETVANIGAWNRRFELYPDLIFPLGPVEEIDEELHSGRTAIIFGCQNCSVIEDDIDLVQTCRDLGIRFMQLTYNNQSLLASGCYEAEDTGITRMGREVIREMNRVGMVVDMSHSGEKSTLQAMEISERPIAITHANPSRWREAPRNKPDHVLKALAESGGMLGFSLYPHHLKHGSDCTLDSFCSMIARTAEIMGIDRIGFGSDLCQDQPDTVVTWMRNGRWRREVKSAPGSEGFPDQPAWFKDNRNFSTILEGLAQHGFSREDLEKIAHGNWLRFYQDSFGAKGS